MAKGHRAVTEAASSSCCVAACDFTLLAVVSGISESEEDTMRMLNPDGGIGLKQLQLYLSTAEAQELCAELNKLLHEPESAEHFHLFSQDGHCELSCSIVTRAKLAGTAYTPAERQAFGSWSPKS